MTRTRPFEAVISDMDGVLTRTADVHERAWKQVFDEYLEQRQAEHGEPFEPFSHDDYRAHVDGKPRYDGVADFLASRRIDLPRGAATDDADARTVCGLGNRKDRMFLEQLASQGVAVFDDTVAALARWRRGGLKLAVISASRNCRQVLGAAGLLDSVDTIVDGRIAEQLGLQGKPDILAEAARRLQVDPQDAVVLEDATAGVRAGRQQGFGLVLGVSRNAHADALRAAGAHQVYRDVYRASFARRIPSALDKLEELLVWQGGRTPAVFLDYDGTLTPIVDDPGAAHLPEAMRTVLADLAGRYPVAIISGRDRADVQARADIPGLLYAGNHGFDIVGRGKHNTLPEAERVVDEVRAAEAQLRDRVGHLPGVIIESKRFSVAVHYRQVGDPDVVAQVHRLVGEIRDGTGLRMRTGKMVLELEPDVEWHKGRALDWLMEVMDIDAARYFPLYVGDDDTDEDAFAALADAGPGIRVGEAVSESLADYRLADPDQVRHLLEWLRDRTG